MKVLCTVVAIVALTLSQPAFAKQKALTDAQLDSITAGNTEGSRPGGGAIVGNSSTATLSFKGAVELEGDAQADARALNLVNSSESAIANGVNVWDGQVTGDAQFSDGANFAVEQFNRVSQDLRRAASIPEYLRPEANVVESGSESGLRSGESTFSNNSTITDTITTTSTRDLTSDSHVEATTKIIGQEIRAGKGIAGTGDLEVNFDGGDISFTGTADIAGVITGEFTFNWELTALNVKFNGGICAAMMASCDSKGTLSESDSTVTDNSQIDTAEGSESFNEEFSSEFALNIRAPFHLADAQAEYIVVDDSTLDVTSENTVSLGGSAQQSLRGLNVVNAAGSAVANAVNVARTNTANLAVGGSRLLTLNQSNVIMHSR